MLYDSYEGEISRHHKNVNVSIKSAGQAVVFYYFVCTNLFPCLYPICLVVMAMQLFIVVL